MRSPLEAGCRAATAARRNRFELSPGCLARQAAVFTAGPDAGSMFDAAAGLILLVKIFEIRVVR